MKNALNTFCNTVLVPISGIALTIIATLVWIGVILCCALQTFDTFRRIEKLISDKRVGVTNGKLGYEWLKVVARLVFFPFVIIIMVLVTFFGYNMFDLTPIMYTLLGAIVAISLFLYFGYRLALSGKNFVRELKAGKFLDALFSLIPICAWIIIIICVFVAVIEVFF